MEVGVLVSGVEEAIMEVDLEEDLTTAVATMVEVEASTAEGLTEVVASSPVAEVASSPVAEVMVEVVVEGSETVVDLMAVVMVLESRSRVEEDSKGVVEDMDVCHYYS